ncbi:MAG TPA: alpha/beta hydrolase [Pyrinomonadaceae bacterium]|nr:alpha/beta hydrolase [Pyrinomonadaceae bacterium]
MNSAITHILRRTAALCGLISILAVAACGQRAEKTKAATKEAPAVVRPAKGARWRDVPEKVDAGAKYLFYLHGIIVENEGIRPTSPDHGVYEYEQILNTFVERGFVVISEARPKGTDPREYASKVVGQIKRLLDAGVPPRNITAVGASRGGGIAMFASTMLKNRDVNFVILAACGDFSIYRDNKVDLWGNVLSIYDFKESRGVGSCQKFVDSSTGVNRHKEIVVKLGLGHGLLYRPLPEWVDPVIEWAK